MTNQPADDGRLGAPVGEEVLVTIEGSDTKRKAKWLEFSGDPARNGWHVTSEDTGLDVPLFEPVTAVELIGAQSEEVAAAPPSVRKRS